MACCFLYFQLLGCAVLGIGIWLQVSKGSYASVVPSVDCLSATVLCMSAGILVLIIGFFGCCGAIMDNQCMLFTVSKLTA
jgi:Tetraspanin family